MSQERLLDAADDFAKSRADRLRLAFRLAGLSPTAYVPRNGALGGPLIESRDPRALAAATRAALAGAAAEQREASWRAEHWFGVARMVSAYEDALFGKR